jgi:hypothetical protein
VVTRLHKATRIVCFENALTQKQATPQVKQTVEDQLAEFGALVVE